MALFAQSVERQKFFWSLKVIYRTVVSRDQQIRHHTDIRSLPAEESQTELYVKE